MAKQGDGDPAALARGLYAEVMVALAGTAALMLAGYSTSIGDDAHADDRNMAMRNAAPLARLEAGLPVPPGPDEPQALKRGDPLHTVSVGILARAFQEAAAKLKDNWQAVVLVADALCWDDRLTQADLDHIIARGQR